MVRNKFSDFLFWIRICIDQILWIRIRLRSIWIHITGYGTYVPTLVFRYLLPILVLGVSAALWLVPGGGHWPYQRRHWPWLRYNWRSADRGRGQDNSSWWRCGQVSYSGLLYVWLIRSRFLESRYVENMNGSLYVIFTSFSCNIRILYIFGSWKHHFKAIIL